MRIAGVNALVVGMAKSGLASVELLLKHGVNVRATDIRIPDSLPVLERLGVPFELQSPDAFQSSDLIVLSPGVPADLEPLDTVRKAGVNVIGEVELAGFFLQGNVIGITGSNGKTTTTALIGHLLQQAGIPAQVGGNIGTPVSAMVDSSRPDQWNVIELSSFQLETICEFRAHIGVGLNVSPDHLDRHHTFARYTAAKGRLFETQQPGDFAILNADDQVCASYAALTRGSPLWFSSTRPVEPGVWLDNDRLWFNGEFFMEAAQIPIRGRHNVENTMAAAAAARLAGAELSAIARGVSSFRAVEHRLEFVRNLSGVDFYNDSKATNVDATLKALDAFEGGLWVILGGKDKGSDYSVLKKPLASKARGALLIGAAASKIAGQLQNSSLLLDCKVLDAAVRQAYERAGPGDTVLLAPACASFDQFENYEHRGRAFKEIVLNLEPKA